MTRMTTRNARSDHAFWSPCYKRSTCLCTVWHKKQLSASNMRALPSPSIKTRSPLQQQLLASSSRLLQSATTALVRTVTGSPKQFHKTPLRHITMELLAARRAAIKSIFGLLRSIFAGALVHDRQLTIFTSEPFPQAR